jgi:uncharacterized protein
MAAPETSRAGAPVSESPLRITALTIFPLKGGRGIPVQTHPLERMGLLGDRRWMLVDQSGTFVSQRTHPRLVHVVPRFDPRTPLELRLMIPGEGVLDLHAPRDPSAAAPLHVEVWDDLLVAHAPSPEADTRLSRFLGAPVRLVYQPDTPIRPLDPRYDPEPASPVSLADGYPILLTTEASLRALNDEIVSGGSAPVEMDRFRPNVVVGDGGLSPIQPYAEDAWRRFELGSVACRGVKLCARCSVTTVDPDTAVRGVEPLRTLARVRGWSGKTWFGQNVVPESSGMLSVGDPVRILEVGWIPGAPESPPHVDAQTGNES